MRSPASAIAWEFRRHLWALGAFAAYLLGVGLLLPILFPGQPVRLDPPDGMGALLVAPWSFVFFYFLAVFSYGLTGDLTGRQSIYPVRFFTLPVTTTALAGWPMLFGAAAMVVMWLLLAALARWPWGVELPVLWPALLGAVFLAWTQVLSWMPYGLTGVRVIAAALWLVALDAIIILAVHFEASEGFMVGFLAPQLPLAYWAACIAVGRARRGDVPDWRARVGSAASPRRASMERPFASAAHAQAWFEWRRHGWSLTAMVALVLPFELGLLFIPVVATPAYVFSTLLAVILTPPVLAGFVAATMRQPNPHARDWSGLPPVDATRPLPTAALVAAKLKTALWSTLAAWLLVVIAVSTALMWSGTWATFVERLNAVTSYIGVPRAITIALLIAVGLLGSTWKRLVQSLYIGLAGRLWVSRASGFAALLVVTALPPTFEWIQEDGKVIAVLWDYWPWIVAALVAVKMSAAAWVTNRLCRSGLLDDRTLLLSAAGWTLAVFALYGVLVWVIDSALIPRHTLAMFAILAVPLARLSAAPLALAWNRHR